MITTMRGAAIKDGRFLSEYPYSIECWTTMGWICILVDPRHSDQPYQWMLDRNEGKTRGKTWEYLRNDLYTFLDPDLAMLFKLTWGGQYDH